MELEAEKRKAARQIAFDALTKIEEEIEGNTLATL